MSGAAEEKRSRGCLEKSRHILPLSVPGIHSRLSPCCPPLLSHMETNTCTSRWLCSHFSFLTCFATVRSLCALFPPSSLLLSSPCVCLCSSSSCLIFLETNYRALQEEKKKNQRGSSFGNVRPASFLLTFMRTSSFPYRISSFP